MVVMSNTQKLLPAILNDVIEHKKMPELSIPANSNYKFPLRSCSRSMDSNNALKLPLPNDFAPLR